MSTRCDENSRDIHVLYSTEQQQYTLLMTLHIRGNRKSVCGIRPLMRQVQVERGQVLPRRHSTEQLNVELADKSKRKPVPTRAPVSSRSAALVLGRGGTTVIAGGYRRGLFREANALHNLIGRRSSLENG
jgi:hypothetical protein